MTAIRGEFPRIWVPRVKIIEPKDPIGVVSRVGGWFRIEAVNARTGRRRLLADWFPNLVTTQGLNLLGAGSNVLNACRVGSGNATPDIGDTNLQSHVAGTTNTQSTISGNSGAPDYYSYRANTYRFSEGAAAGTLAEVGIGTSASNGNNLFSRALILDNTATPTTITVLSDEFLDVTYELRHYPPLGDVSGTVNISGTDHDYLIRAANVDSESRWGLGNLGGDFSASGPLSMSARTGNIAAVTSQPGGTSASMSSGTDAAYTNGNFYRDATYSASLTQGNIGGIRTVYKSMNIKAFQCQFDPVLPKDNTKVMSLVFRNSWAAKAI